MACEFAPRAAPSRHPAPIDSQTPRFARRRRPVHSLPGHPRPPAHLPDCAFALHSLLVHTMAVGGEFGSASKMSEQLPQPAEVFRAIDIYLTHAYSRTTAPATIRNRLEQLRAAQDLYTSPAVERDSKEDPGRYSI